MCGVDIPCLRKDHNYDYRFLTLTQVDKNNDGFVSYEEFIGATKDPEYEKPPEENWKPIDDENEFTDEEFEQYEKEFGEYDEEVRMSSLLL